jgi:hypothetical protein
MNGGGVPILRGHGRQEYQGTGGIGGWIRSVWVGVIVLGSKSQALPSL